MFPLQAAMARDEAAGYKAQLAEKSMILASTQAELEAARAQNAELGQKVGECQEGTKRGACGRLMRMPQVWKTTSGAAWVRSSKAASHT
jgi:hypothetical protein